MNYKGFTILHSPVRGWIVRVNVHHEYLAASKEDAMYIVDTFLAPASSTIAA